MRVRVVVRKREEAGFVLVYMALTIVVLLALAAFALDVGNWYLVAQREQKAADAAALSGVIYLPGQTAQATTNACNVAGANGFSDAGCTGAVQPSGNNPQVVVSPVSGNPYQLKVTVTKNVPNNFANVMGYNNQTIVRSAIAEYEAPVSMGTPCNIFASEATDAANLSSDASWSNAPSGNSAACAPNLWANVMGPHSNKENGDAVQAGVCNANSVDGCSGISVNPNLGNNVDYQKSGYFYRVIVSPAAMKQALANHYQLAVEVYDPASVQVGNHCEYGGLDVASGASSGSPAVNPYTNAQDAPHRYAYGDQSNALIVSGGSLIANPKVPFQSEAGKFCSGDNNDFLTPSTTTYVVRQDTNPYQVNSNPPVSTGGCGGEQFGYWTAPSSGTWADLLNNKPGSTTYDASLAKVFRQWVPICVFDPSAFPANDYLVQVRTNIDPTTNQGGPGCATADTMCGPAPATLPNTGDSNRFAIRAAFVPATAVNWAAPSANPLAADSTNNPFVGGYDVPGPSPVSDSTAQGGVSLSGTNTMGLYANSSNTPINGSTPPTPNFYMARVLPGGKGQTLQIRLWDIGDCGATYNGVSSGNCSPTLTFHLPNPGNPSSGAVPNCSVTLHDGPPNGATPITNPYPQGGNCMFTVNAGGTSNGSWFTINIPIPQSYGCDSTNAFDCWITMSYAAGGTDNALDDTTTWGAQLLGNPVILVQ